MLLVKNSLNAVLMLSCTSYNCQNCWVDECMFMIILLRTYEKLILQN